MIRFDNKNYIQPKISITNQHFIIAIIIDYIAPVVIEQMQEMELNKSCSQPLISDSICNCLTANKESYHVLLFHSKSI
jgi:hypothetical protein